MNHTQDWEEEFRKLIHGYHGNETQLVHDNEFFYNIEDMVSFITKICTEAIAQTRRKERDHIYNHLLSIEARMSKEGIESDYENGYFEAVDDIVKYINSPLE